MSSPTQGRLQGRVAIITGSSGGLGRAISVLFASEGAKCFCVDKYAYPRNPINAVTGKADDWNSRLTPADTPEQSDSDNKSQQHKSIKKPAAIPADHATTGKPDHTTPTHLLLQHRYGVDSASFHAADLTQEAQVQNMIQTCVSLHSRIDILINSHGISTESTHPVPLRCHDLPLSDFLLTQSINSTSFFLTCKHFLSQLVSPAEGGKRQKQLYPGGRGWIVNVASVQGLTPYFATPGYCASKGAAVMLTRQLALDYAADGVRVNCICPGFLDTNMTRNLQNEAEGEKQSKLKGVLNRQVLRVDEEDENDEKEKKRGQLGQVEDVARMVLVMASDDVRWMTGQPVVVDGGYMIS